MKTKTFNCVRLGDGLYTDKIELCKHITIEGKIMEGDEGWLYTSNIPIICKKCNQKFIIEEIIN